MSLIDKLLKRISGSSSEIDLNTDNLEEVEPPVEEFITDEAMTLYNDSIKAIEQVILSDAMKIVVADNRKKIEVEDMITALDMNGIKVEID